MNVIRAIVGFFADDLLTAGLVIFWVAIAGVANRLASTGAVGTLIYVIGFVGIVIFGTLRRAKASR